MADDWIVPGAAPAATTAGPDDWVDPPRAPKIDWSQVKTPADVSKALDAIKTPDGKLEALRDWARTRVETEANAGLVPTENPATYTPGAGVMDAIGAGGNAVVNALTGGRYGNTYQQERALQDARNDYAYEHSSKLGHAMAVAGGIVAGSRLPILEAAPTTNILGRSANAALTGGIVGGVEGASQGDSLDDAAQKGGWGALEGSALGAGLNPVAEGIGNAVGYVKNALKPLPEELQYVGRGAANRIAAGLKADSVTPTAYAQRSAALGPEAMLADYGPNMQLQTGAIANRLGAGRDMITRALEARNAAAPQAVEQAVTGALGPQQNLTRLEVNTAEGANKAAEPHYAAFESANIPMTPRLADILDQAKAWGAIAPARQMAAGQGLKPQAINRLVPDPMSPMTGLNRNVTDLVPTGKELNYVKTSLDALAKREFDSGDIHKGVLINRTAQGLTDEVDRILSPNNPAASPYAQARALAQTGKGFSQGLREGKGTFSHPSTHNPDVVEYDLDPQRPGYSTSYGVGYRAAARGDLSNMMNDATTQFGPTGDRAVRKGLWSPNAERKVNMLAQTPQAADELLRVRNAQTTFADTRNEALKGAQTARRISAQKLYPSSTEGGGFAHLLHTTIPGLAVVGGKVALNAMTAGMLNKHIDKIAEGAARMLTATGEDRDIYFNGLRNYMQTRGLSAHEAAAVTQAVRRAALGLIGQTRLIDSMNSQTPAQPQPKTPLMNAMTRGGV